MAFFIIISFFICFERFWKYRISPYFSNPHKDAFSKRKRLLLKFNFGENRKNDGRPMQCAYQLPQKGLIFYVRQPFAQQAHRF